MSKSIKTEAKKDTLPAQYLILIIIDDIHILIVDSRVGFALY